MAVGTFSISLRDFDKQIGVFSINVDNPTATNMAAHITETQALKSAVDNITLGSFAGSRLTRVVSGTNAAALDPAAMRGNKWVVKATDGLIELAAGVPNPSFGKPFDTQVPTADLSLRIGNSNVIWSFGDNGIVPEMDAFVDAFEAIALSPNGGQLVVQSIESNTTSGG